MYRSICLAAILAAGAAAPALGQSAPAASRLSLTIYNNDLALVQEQRSLNVPAGRTRMEFKDVSASIKPETVALSADGVAVVEQNFDYDLLSPAKLMEKAVGQQVRIVRTNPGNGQQTTETATVLSVQGGVVLRIGERIEVLRDDGVPTRVIFDKVPDNLRPRPTLSVTVQAETGGARPATLTYLTTGLSWKADYVALFDEAAGRLGMQGWITLSNKSGTSFADADTQLVAGDINLTRDWNPRYETRHRVTASRAAGSELAVGPSLADYYLYPLGHRTTVADNQTKQVGFLSAEGVTAKKAYEYRAFGFETQTEPVHADVVVNFANAAQSGLGAPLPAGIVRVYVRDAAGEAKFVGEDRVQHTPQGSLVSVKTGEAFDVTVQPTVVSHTSGKRNSGRYAMTYLVRNARTEPLAVDIRQGGLWRNGRVVSESLPSRRLDAGNLAWTVPVPANGEATLNFTVDVGW